MLGNGRLEAMCFDGVKRLCHIRGKLRKKVWINQSDIILVGLRDYQVRSYVNVHLSPTLFQDTKADVILKYSADEARNLKSYGEFPDSIKISDTVDFVGGDLDDDIEFDDVDSDDSGSGGDDPDDIDGIQEKTAPVHDECCDQALPRFGVHKTLFYVFPTTFQRLRQ